MPAPISESRPDEELALQFLGVRRAIGGVGLVLPLVLRFGGDWFFGLPQQPTISDYHGTQMRDGFVGLLCAIGLFLLAYRGYDVWDRVATLVAGFSAGVVAFYPNTGWTEDLHVGAATVFFVTLAVMSFFLFTRSSAAGKNPDPKRNRNGVYRACGALIALCILLIFTHEAWTRGSEDWVDRNGLVFWLEALAVWFFAISWLVKGETLRLPGVRKLFKPLVDEKDRGPG